MPSYKVMLCETAQYTINVEAANEDEARAKAEAKYLASIKCDFETEVFDREVTSVTPLRGVLGNYIHDQYVADKYAGDDDAEDDRDQR